MRIPDDRILELVMFVIPIFIGVILTILKYFNIVNISFNMILWISMPLPIILILFYATLFWIMKR